MTFRIFLAYDIAHDQDLCDQVQASSGHHGVFEVCGRSRGGELTDPWHQRTQGEIGAADQLVVICGEHTDESPQVAAELRMAKEQDTPVVLLWSRREGMCKKPVGATANDSMYSWTPDILRDQLVANQRKAQPTPVPERLKRATPPAAETKS